MPRSHRYSSTAKWFHWLIVCLVGLELLIALVMPRVRRVTTPSMLINLHMSFGVLIIVVMLLRLLWRMTHPVPPLPRRTRGWQILAAYLMHYLLYILLFLIPFAGWVWANALGWQVTVFGLFTFPAFVPKGSPFLSLAATTHLYLTVTICILIALHVLASLYHWYVKKDDVLERMLPEDRLTDRILTYFDRLR